MHALRWSAYTQLSDPAKLLWWTTSGENSSNQTVTSTTTTPKLIVEATGWVVNEKGEVILTADSPTTTPRSPWQTLAYCSVQNK